MPRCFQVAVQAVLRPPSHRPGRVRKAVAVPAARAVAVAVEPARTMRLGLEIEALGTARANESIDVTAKISNQVTAVRFTEGQQVKKGSVLVELDSEQARADLAVAAAALKESTSQYQRSRELYDTKVLSDSQIEQIEATFRANEARVAAARARLNDTFVQRTFRRASRAASHQRRQPRRTRRRDHDAR